MMSDIRVNGKRRELWLDILRALAACAVVMMHTLTGAVDIFSAGEHANGKALLIIMDLVTWCVPVFLMISGYLFLNPKKQIGLVTMVRKYCLRIVLALLLFGIPFACLELVLAERTFRIGMVWEGLLMVLTMQSWSHLWYLYLILLLYFLTPAMKWLLERLPDWAVILLEVLLVAGSSILPFAGELGASVMPVFPDELIYVFYYLFGYCLHMKGKKVSRKGEVLSPGALILAVIAGMIGYRLTDAEQIQMAYNYPPTVLLALGLMCLGKGLQGNGSGWFERVALGLSGLSFGIYLVHPVFLNFFYKFLHVTPMEGMFAVRFPIFFGVTLLGAAGVTWVLNKITPLRRYVL